MDFFFLISFIASKIPSLVKVAAEDKANLKEEVGKIPGTVQTLIDWGLDVGKHLLVAILIYVVGRFCIKMINRFIQRLLDRRKVEVSIKTFLKSLVNIMLTILLIVAVVNELGIDTTSFAALLAAAGVAIGMAFSGNLQNFAGGLIVLLFKPYKVGDYIEAQGVSGTVKEIQVFHTILLTYDNKVIYIPNGPLSSNLVTNYSREESRMAEWVIGIDYGEDFDKVKSVILSILAKDVRVLSTPGPFIALKALDTSSVNVVIRAWVKTENYYGLYYDMNKAIYEMFNAQGINFPFPQITVHQGV
jgi:small conductance mechanosensitive channel